MKNSILKIAFFASIALAAGGISTAQAQMSTGDVCCVGYTDAGADIGEVFAGPMKASACKSGSKDDAGRIVCGSAGDLNQCASVSQQQICGTCGLNWIPELTKCSKKSLAELAPKKEGDDRDKTKDAKKK